MTKKQGDHPGLTDPPGGALRAENFSCWSQKDAAQEQVREKLDPPLLENMRKVAAASKTKTGTWLTASKKTGALVGQPTQS